MRMLLSLRPRRRHDHRRAWADRRSMAAATSTGGRSGPLRFLPRGAGGLCLLLGMSAAAPLMADEDEYYRIVTIATSAAETDSRAKFWKPAPEELVLEVSGIAVLPRDRLAVAIRKGEIWLLDGVYDDPPRNVSYQKFAEALHEPLGLAYRDGAFFAVQRSELTKIHDADGDGRADHYVTLAKGWGTTGNYHEYAYGPVFDHDGNLWLTLNIGVGLGKSHRERLITEPRLGVSQARWRGWGMKVTPAGELIPVCAGMRSPSGLGINRQGDLFYTDQQGNWVGTNSLHHMRPGAFFHHPESLASMHQPGSPLPRIESIPAGLPYPEAVKQCPQLKPPAVWFPYKKVGQSITDIVADNSHGSFGPFDGQFFVGEFTLSSVYRVYLEQVNGQYQGACFPFREGFASAVIRLAQGADGSLFAGLSNRGWSSLGPAAYGLQRLVWTGKTPFEIAEMRAQPDGFDLIFTLPVDRNTAADPDAYALQSYTYAYQETYGSDEIQHRELAIQRAEVSEDGLRVRLTVDGLRQHFVHELTAGGVRSRDGGPLLHPDAYYTLNRIPSPTPDD